MLSQIRWHQANAEANPFEYLNVIRKAIHWWNGRQMDKYISNELTKRYREYKAENAGKRTKAIIDLVLQNYMPGRMSLSSVDELDPDFRAFAISQIRLFIFVGHDSTSSTICYILHLLYTNLMHYTSCVGSTKTFWVAKLAMYRLSSNHSRISSTIFRTPQR